MTYSYGGLTAGSTLIDGDWVVVALTDGKVPTIQTEAPGGNHLPDSGIDDDFDSEILQGERSDSDGHVVVLVHVPADAEAVSITIPDAGRNESSGFGFERPGS
jgi:hypothetical protein